MNIKTTYAEWLPIAKIAGYKLQTYSRPEKMGGHAVPETFNELTIGQVMELSSLGTEDDAVEGVCRVVLGMTPDEVRRARAVDVVRFAGWAMAELAKINELFKAAQIEPTAEERRAGIASLNFGLFGMIDWYAQRMGIHDHDEVLGVNWMRVYKCVDMDNKKTIYQRRLQEVINNEYRRKNSSRRQ